MRLSVRWPEASPSACECTGMPGRLVVHGKRTVRVYHVRLEIVYGTNTGQLHTCPAPPRLTAHVSILVFTFQVEWPHGPCWSGPHLLGVLII